MAQSQYLKEPDEITDEMLVDFSNLDNPPPNFTKFSMARIFAGVLSIAIWGLRKYMDFITRQVVPSPENDTEFLNRHGGIYDITRTSDDTNATYLDKILTRLRFPPAGGNANDYEVWARDARFSFVTDPVTDVVYTNKFATIVDVIFGPGTVGVFTIPNDESIIFDPALSLAGANTSVAPNLLVDAGATFVTAGVLPGFIVKNTSTNFETYVTSVAGETTLSLNDDIFLIFPENYAVLSLEEQLRQVTFAYIETVRPLGINPVTVISAKPLQLNVNIEVIAETNLNSAEIISQTTAAINDLGPGESFFTSPIVCIALDNGAKSAVITYGLGLPPTLDDPAFPVDNSNFYRPNTITVSIT